MGQYTATDMAIERQRIFDEAQVHIDRLLADLDSMTRLAKEQMKLRFKAEDALDQILSTITANPNP